MKIIGLTGGMASGKSTISQYLRAEGIAVFDADETAKKLVAVGSPCLKQIEAVFGKGVFTAAGELDRKKTAELVFENRAARKQLENILHTEIWRQAEAFIAGHKKERLVVLDVPLLIECGWHKRVDTVWLASIDEAEQIRRAMLRDSICEADVRARLAVQMPLREKQACATVIFDNNGSKDDLLKQVAIALKAELA